MNEENLEEQNIENQKIEQQEPDFSKLLDEIEENETIEQKTMQDVSLAKKEVETSVSDDNLENKQQKSFVQTLSQEEVEEKEENVEELITVRPVKFQEFEQTPPIRSIKKNLDIMQDVSMHISVELGKTKSSIREVIEMGQGSVVELDKIAGEQVEVYVNEKLVAKGEVIVIEDKFGVRITSTSLPKNIE